MKKLVFLAWVAIAMLAVGVADAGTAYLLNFGSGLKDDPLVNSVTNDGVYYWNKFNDVEWFKNDFGASIQLVDVANAPGVTFSYTFENKMSNNLGMPSWESLKVWGNPDYPDLWWYDGTKDELRGMMLTSRNEGYRAWNISGFDPAETVTIEWVASRPTVSGVINRFIDIAADGLYSNVIEGKAVTSQQFATDGYQDEYMKWELTGADNYTLEFDTSVCVGWGPGIANAILIQVGDFTPIEPPAKIPGDANGDNVVDDLDAKALAGSWGLGDATWAMGDFNGDGIVDAKDASILAANWGAVAPPLAEASAAVPEPGAVVLMLAALAALAWKRRY